MRKDNVKTLGSVCLPFCVAPLIFFIFDVQLVRVSGCQHYRIGVILDEPQDSHQVARVALEVYLIEDEAVVGRYVKRLLLLFNLVLRVVKAYAEELVEGLAHDARLLLKRYQQNVRRAYHQHVVALLFHVCAGARFTRPRHKPPDYQYFILYDVSGYLLFVSLVIELYPLTRRGFNLYARCRYPFVWLGLFGYVLVLRVSPVSYGFAEMK